MIEKETLLTTIVPRTLETKAKILGLELSDVLLLLLNLSVQNLIFGTTDFKIPMVFGTSLVLGFFLLIFKRGKPDHYIQHSLEHLVQPAVRSANAKDELYRPFQGRWP